MEKDLIYDVGAHLGYDTAYYLNAGYRVVAIEANPKSVLELRAKFAKEIATERLVIIDKAIDPVARETVLYISKSDSGSCSILKDEVDDISESIVVKCCKLGELFKQYGVPFYVKVDIQGADRYCLESLSKQDSPEYLSWELDRDQLACLEIVKDLGYKRFKLIDQTCFLEMQHSFSLVRKIRRKFRRLVGEQGEKHPSHAEWEFRPGHSSGPFGENTDGPWRNYNEVCRQWRKFNQMYPTRHDQPSWFDCHAGH